ETPLALLAAKGETAMSPEQRPADEDEIKRAEREYSHEEERERPATEEEIQEAEKEAKDESSTISNVGGSPPSIQHGGTWPPHGSFRMRRTMSQPPSPNSESQAKTK